MLHLYKYLYRARHSVHSRASRRRLRLEGVQIPTSICLCMLLAYALSVAQEDASYRCGDRHNGRMQLYVLDEFLLVIDILIMHGIGVLKNAGVGLERRV